MSFGNLNKTFGMSIYIAKSIHQSLRAHKFSQINLNKRIYINSQKNKYTSISLLLVTKSQAVELAFQVSTTHIDHER